MTEEKKPTNIASVKEGALLPLDEERCITFKDGNHLITYYFDRFTQPDWEKFINGISLSAHNEGNAEVKILDLDSAGVQLVESKVKRVDGYVTGFCDRPNWKEKLPLRHTRPVALLLRTASASDVESETMDPECFEVIIDAAWNMVKPGEMKLYTGLVHRFRAMTAEQKRQFNRQSSSTKVVGGSRNGRTIFAPKQQFLLRLYNELVMSVDGYSVAGRAITSAEDAIREVDAWHKCVAVELLFRPADAITEPEEGEGAAA